MFDRNDRYNAHSPYMPAHSHRFGMFTQRHLQRVIGEYSELIKPASDVGDYHYAACSRPQALRTGPGTAKTPYHWCPVLTTIGGSCSSTRIKGHNVTSWGHLLSLTSLLLHACVFLTSARIDFLHHYTFSCKITTFISPTLIAFP
jgi:hypothetical protein